MSIFSTTKRIIERLFHCKIYRDSLPRGSDFFSDLSKLGKADSFRTVIDVGAHQGESVGRYVSFFPAAHICALEPSPESFALLTKQFASEPRVRLFREAAGAVSGEATLYMKRNTSTHSLRLAEGAVGKETVKVTTLDEFAVREGFGRVDFCKIDTEGADLQVLEGAAGLLAEHRIRLVQVETSTRHDTDYFSGFFEINKLLASHGYELFGIYEQMPCWTGRQSLLFFNAVFVASSEVNRLPVL